MELAVDPVERAWSGLVADRRPHRLAPDNALKAHRSHEPGNGASGDIEAFPLQLPPDFPHAIDPVVGVKHAAYLDLQADVATSADRQAIHIRALGDRIVIGGRGNRQQFADRLDPKHRTVLIDEGNHRFSGRSSSAWAK